MRNSQIKMLIFSAFTALFLQPGISMACDTGYHRVNSIEVGPTGALTVELEGCGSTGIDVEDTAYNKRLYTILSAAQSSAVKVRVTQNTQKKITKVRML